MTAQAKLKHWAMLKGACSRSVLECVQSSAALFFASSAFVFVTALHAFAHDPYEITSTFSLYANRGEMRIELEYRAAALLAGAPVTNENAGGFDEMRPALESAANKFYRISAGGKELVPDSVNVSLGVENHVQLRLSFPSVFGQPLGFEAVGLKNLSGEGPYGASLTALDMENKKVLGQAVLFQETAPVEFYPPSKASTPSPTGSTESTVPQQVINLRNAQLLPARATTDMGGGAHFALRSADLWILAMGLIELAVIRLMWIRLRRKDPVL